MHARNVVVLGKLHSIKSLSTCWGSRNKNLYWIEPTEFVELCFKRTDVSEDSELRMPWKLVLLD